MSCNAGRDPLDLERLVTTSEDLLALRQARSETPMSTEAFLRALAHLALSREVLRERRGPAGTEPFRL